MPDTLSVETAFEQNPYKYGFDSGFEPYEINGRETALPYIIAILSGFSTVQEFLDANKFEVLPDGLVQRIVKE